MILPPIEFDGKTVTPKGGVYRCPHKCSQSGYPQPTWKTEKGFRRHIASCPKGSTFKAEAIAKEEANEADKAAFVASHPFKHSVGDTIYFVRQFTVKPSRDSRGRRVRYEDVYRFSACSLTVKSLGAGNYYGSIAACYLGEHEAVFEVDALPDQASADRIAAEKQSAHDEHLRFSAFCR